MGLHVKIKILNFYFCPFVGRTIDAETDYTDGTIETQSFSANTLGRKCGEENENSKLFRHIRYVRRSFTTNQGSN